MICPGDNFLLSQLNKTVKTFSFYHRAEICCTRPGDWSEAARDNNTRCMTTTIKHRKIMKLLFLFHKKPFFSFAVQYEPPTHVDKVTSAFLPSHGVFDAGPQRLRGSSVKIIISVSSHFTCHVHSQYQFPLIFPSVVLILCSSGLPRD